MSENETKKVGVGELSAEITVLKRKVQQQADLLNEQSQKLDTERERNLERKKEYELAEKLFIRILKGLGYGAK